MKTIAVYGSLKKGRYNNPMLTGSKFLGESKIKADMYSLGSYPAITDGEDMHNVELYEVDSSVYDRVHSMEIGAGYIEKDVEFEVEGSKIVAGVYYAGEYLAEHCKKFRNKIEAY